MSQEERYKARRGKRERERVRETVLLPRARKERQILAFGNYEGTQSPRGKKMEERGREGEETRRGKTIKEGGENRGRQSR